jgi:hypothetical protein
MVSYAPSALAAVAAKEPFGTNTSPSATNTVPAVPPAPPSFKRGASKASLNSDRPTSKAKFDPDNEQVIIEFAVKIKRSGPPNFIAIQSKKEAAARVDTDAMDISPIPEHPISPLLKVIGKIKTGDKPNVEPKLLMMPLLEHQLQTMQITHKLCTSSTLNKAHVYFQLMANCTKDLQNISNNQDGPAHQALSDTIMNRMGTSICGWMTTVSDSQNAYSLQMIAEDLGDVLQCIDSTPTWSLVGKSHHLLKCDPKAKVSLPPSFLSHQSHLIAPPATRTPPMSTIVESDKCNKRIDLMNHKTYKELCDLAIELPEEADINIGDQYHIRCHGLGFIGKSDQKLSSSGITLLRPQGINGFPLFYNAQGDRINGKMDEDGVVQLHNYDSMSKVFETGLAMELCEDEQGYLVDELCSHSEASKAFKNLASARTILRPHFDPDHLPFDLAECLNMIMRCSPSNYNKIRTCWAMAPAVPTLIRLKVTSAITLSTPSTDTAMSIQKEFTLAHTVPLLV